MPARTLADVADELYALPPAQFTAARDEMAKEVRAAGQREEAAAIKKLARPTASAWLVNQLARDAPEQMARLFEVGDELQEAQRILAGDRLRELSARRRQVIGELMPFATSLAGRAGQSASAAVLDEVRGTLEAALSDPGARQAIQSGRLTRALAYAGLGEVDLSSALAVPVDAPPATVAEPSRTKKPGRKAKPGAEAEAAADAEADAEAAAEADRAARARRTAQALAAAQSAADAASAALADAESHVAAIGQQRQFLGRRISHLERELAQAKAEDARLAREAEEAESRRDEAARDAEATQQRLGELSRP